MTHRKDARLIKSAQGKASSKVKARHRPPDGEPFVWFTREMLMSIAFKKLCGNSRRVLDCLLLEHMAHAGTENGNLVCTHATIKEYGVRAGSIAHAIHELNFMGFVRYEKGYAFQGNNVPSRFRLTWLPDAKGEPATNEWKAINSAHVVAYNRQERDRKQKDKECRLRNKAAKQAVVGSNVVKLEVGNG